MSKTSTVSIPVPASQVTAPAVSVPVPPVMAPSQPVPVPGSQVTLTIVDTTANGVTTTLSGNTLTVADATATPPPPTKVPSANGATITPQTAGQIIDATLNVWTFGAATGDSRGNPVIENGQTTPNAGVLLLFWNNVMYVQTASGTWWTVTGVRQAGDPRGTVTPPPPPPNPNPTPGALAAFPGAQGGGALAAGGRGGAVIEVTNLNDSGPGSLRAALMATGPRTVVFRVAGLITPKSDVTIGNPFLTVAGQTAPGQIIIGGPGNNGFNFRVSTNDTVVRYITFSPDDRNQLSGPSTGTVGFTIVNGNCFNNIQDHCTHRWAGNKSWLALANFVQEFFKDMTMQWCLQYEPHAGHPVGPSTSTNGDLTRNLLNTNNDFHHNVYVNHSHRIPEVNNKNLRWVNNWVHNYLFYANEYLGGMTVDVIGNRYSWANLGPPQTYPIHASDGVGNTEGNIPTNPSMYVAGNIGPGKSAVNADQIGELTYQITGENGDEINGHFPASWLRAAPQPASNAFPISVDDATQLAAILLPTVGNSQHLDLNGNWVSHRDQADTRVTNQVKNLGPGGFWPNGLTQPITNQTSPSQIPVPTDDYVDKPMTNFTPYPSSQHDGLSDAWKQAIGLDTSKPQNNVVMPDGYTALEWFLSGRKS